MWIYDQSRGDIYYTGLPLTKPVGRGYSGAGDHMNNQDSQCIKDLGPIPVGEYLIGAPTDFGTPSHLIKYALPLTPKSGTNVCGRTGFYIHGDSAAFPQWASAGCIILDKNIREKIVLSGNDTLRVVPFIVEGEV